jgi:DNA-3-methyladenine glycosylase II
VERNIWRISKDHRFVDQIQFVSQFPAYTVDTSAQEVVWWYRQHDEVNYIKFGLSETGTGVMVIGDQILARMAMRSTLPPVAKPDGVKYLEFHQTLYERFRGVRPVLFLDAFEGIAWAILGQQINVNFAAHLKTAIAVRWGTVVRGGQNDLAVFPSPRQLAGAKVEELRSLQLSRQKAETLIEIARHIDQGTWNIQDLYHQSTEEAMENLQKFKGVGPWTAEYSLLRVFGHVDVIPAADVGLRRAWARLTGRERVSEADLLEAAQIWRGYRSDFAFWLWLSNVSPRGLSEEHEG